MLSFQALGLNKLSARLMSCAMKPLNVSRSSLFLRSIIKAIEFLLDQELLEDILADSDYFLSHPSVSNVFILFGFCRNKWGFEAAWIWT